MLTSPIKPRLPSPSSTPCSCSFSLPACHLNFSATHPPTTREILATNPRLLRCSSHDSPAATALSVTQPILVVFLVLVFIIKKFEKKRHRLARCNASRTPYVLLTFHEGGPYKLVPPRSSMLIRSFILPGRSHVKSRINV